LQKIYVAMSVAVFGSAIGGCTVPTNVAPAQGAAAEVASGKVMNSPVAVEYAFQPTDLDVKISPIGARGSACSFPLTLSNAFYQTFDGVNHQAFRNVVPAGTPQAYRVHFELSSFDHDLMFADKFMGSTAVAHASFSVRVSVFDPNSHELARQSIQGTGQQLDDVGACPDGAATLSKAIQKALEMLGEEYADRIVNSLTIP
jgi:hypothetical protein